MDVTIANEILEVKVKAKGAELYSVKHKKNNLQYMWSGDPAYWGKTSPVLFPVVGALKEGKYLYNGKAYELSRHGFARDHEFEIEQQGNEKVIFVLKGEERFLNVYPFPFVLRIQYALEGSNLSVTYIVENKGKTPMYFSIGGHPAFKVPLTEGTIYQDYFLHFNKAENAPRYPIAQDGCIEEEPHSMLNNSRQLFLTKDLFKDDALVFKNLRSSSISIKSHKHEHGLDFYFDGFPFFGIWAAPKADFVCLEPWCGVADAVNHDQQLTTKEGIEQLAAGEKWKRTWSINCY